MMMPTIDNEGVQREAEDAVGRGKGGKGRMVKGRECGRDEEKGG